MTKVTLRMKPITGGRQTLYLDYYPPIPHPVTGKTTRREFLGLFINDEVEHKEESYTDSTGKPQKRIVPVLNKKGEPKPLRLNPVEKQHNKETYALAEAIKAKRQIAIQNGNFGFLSNEKRNADFVGYFEILAKKRAGSNSDNWLSALNFIKDFTGGSFRFKDLNEAFCNDFKEFLLQAPSKRSSKTTLSQNSALSYFNKFKAVLKQAYKEGFLQTDLNKSIENIKQAETERQFLTLDELQRLAKTDCAIPVLKQASLFSALTGLRFSDIKKLVWAEVQHSAMNGYYIRFRQKKTKGTETLPISEQAFSILGERGEATAPVFKELKYSAWQNLQLQKWIEKAGIHKEITFHCFRHTYATLQLSLGTDLYTVSKMLGHRELKTTQVYAKIIDKQKREAANKITLEL